MPFKKKVPVVEDVTIGEGDSTMVEDAEGETSTITTIRPDDEARRAQNRLIDLIDSVSTYLCEYEVEDGVPVAINFQRLPNKRHIPDYFDVIKQPAAFSTVRSKCLRKLYRKFPEFVNDVALICYNAQLYNTSTSEIHERAVQLREIFVKKLQELVDQGKLSAEDVVLPDYGEIPPDEDMPMGDETADDGAKPEEAEDEDEDGENDSDDEEDQDEDEEEGARRRGRGRARGRQDDKGGEDGPQKRGRPPKVFTPTEARIQALLKGLRKSKGPDGQPHVFHFERLPDKASNKDYYAAVAKPIALDNIKKKAKRKKYTSLDQVMADLELMVTNAMNYNEDGSPVYNDAVALRDFAKKLAAQEQAKPDESFRDEDGKLPLSSAEYNGTTWKIGDWILIRNLNDPQKPIVSQIFRIWQDESGQRWVNACWYYRPEQTVHRANKRFYVNEVVKTGQYRDHHIEDIVGQCFVMFITRFFRGRPHDFTGDKEKEVYVCEARYNEEKFTFNKIKTWTSCLPDEVRDIDYVMDPFPTTRAPLKEPSPIKHLIKADAKETDPLPKPTWGNPNAPPLIGAVHIRPREHNDSLSPPPVPVRLPPPPPEVRRPSVNASAGTPASYSARATAASAAASYSQTSFAPNSRSASSFTPSQNLSQHTPAHSTPQTYTPQSSSHAAMQSNGYGSSYGQHHQSQSTTSMAQRTTTGNDYYSQGYAGTSGYKAPEPYEVWRLREDVDAQIPSDVRQQYLADEQGRLLFFTQPPQQRPHPGVSEEHANLGHSVRYLADRERARGNEDAVRINAEKAQVELRQRKAASSQQLKEIHKKRSLESFLGVCDTLVTDFARETNDMLEDLQSWRGEMAAWHAERDAVLASPKDTEESGATGVDAFQHYSKYNKLTSKQRDGHYRSYQPPSWQPKISSK